jgi:hypothetical protein
MSNDLFPRLRGLKWDVKVGVERAASLHTATVPGYETSLSFGPDPLFHFQCDYEFLRELVVGADNQPTGVNELRKLMGFFSAHADYQSFLLFLPALTQNPDDGSVEGQPLTPDASGVAPLVVTRDVYDENIYELARDDQGNLSTPQLYMNGAPMTPTTDYTIQGPGYAESNLSYGGLVAVISKAITGPVTADIGWCYRVRFEQNKQEFNLFSYLLWNAQQMQMVTRRN